MIRMTALLGLMTSVAFAPAAHAQRGSDGTLRLIFHQAVSILNPYLSGGTKDIDAASLVLEPLAGFDENGHLVPRLAEAVPTVENGGVAADRRSVTWRLRLVTITACCAGCMTAILAAELPLLVWASAQFTALILSAS